MQTPPKFSNKEVVKLLKEIQACMEVKDFNKFRIRAYQNAIGAIDNLTSSVHDLWENGRLGEVPGVGQGLEAHLTELFTTGEVQEFKKFREGLPDGMFALLGLRGIGAKKAFKLASQFKLKDRETAIEQVKELATAGKIQVLEGFGAKSEKDILEAVSELKKHKSGKTRMLLVHAEEISNRIIDYIKTHKDVKDAISLGSMRRRQSTVGDLDIAASTNNPKAVVEHFLQFGEIQDVLAKGDEKASVVLKTDVQVDFRVSRPEAIGSMMQYFTGSKQHNVILRTYALEKGLSLSEYGIKQGNKLHEFADEESFYKKVGLPYIPPEIRHGIDEVGLAAQGKLPKLVELSDIKGDVHTHTTASDGVNTLKEMVDYAKSKKYNFIGIADHSPSVQSRGLDEVKRIIAARRKEIEHINASQSDVRVLFGYEVNILTDAKLALPDEILKELDYVIASIHASFDQDRETVTNRMIAAIENPYVSIIGHPSGRLINEREGCDLDWTKIFRAAADNNKILEINSSPQRLDLADDLVREAIRCKVKLIINTDAHETSSLDLMHYGLDVARRGMATKETIVNTKDTEDFLKELRYY